eukprot:scaffold229405_cov19-Tisochrysis_lutea.AAC.2
MLIAHLLTCYIKGQLLGSSSPLLFMCYITCKPAGLQCPAVPACACQESQQGKAAAAAAGVSRELNDS